MYIYKVSEVYEDNTKEERYLTHDKKYSEDDFNELLYLTRNSIRPFVTIYRVVRELKKDGFKEMEVQAEDEFDTEGLI